MVTDPPHAEVDHKVVAKALGLELAFTSPKIAFKAPEVLRAAEPSVAAPFAHLLKDAGLKVAVIDGQNLARIPWPRPVSSFAFGHEGLVCRGPDWDELVGYGEPVIAVYCKPPEGYKRDVIPEPAPNATGAEISDAIDGMAILDMFVERDGELARVSIVQDVADFSGLGGLIRDTADQNMAATVAECGRRFQHIRLDTRLEGVRPRRKFVPGVASFDHDLRKHYSFGTLLLRYALGEISPELRDLTHYEYGSRLGCVLARAHLD